MIELTKTYHSVKRVSFSIFGQRRAIELYHIHDFNLLFNGPSLLILSTINVQSVILVISNQLALVSLIPQYEGEVIKYWTIDCKYLNHWCPQFVLVSRLLLHYI